MKWLNTLLLLLSSLLISPRFVLAELTFTVEATQDGVPIPASEIKLEPFQPGSIGETSRNSSSNPKPPGRGDRRLHRRSNPVAYSANWCGAVRHTSASPSTSQVKLIHGEFQHPSCTKRTGASYPQAAAAWVGIDGDTSTSALLQAGTVCKFDTSTSSVVNQVWWQWVPTAAYYVTSMSLSAGDWMEFIINTTSTTAGKVTINNLSKGTSYSMTINSGPTLSRVDAEWVIERPTYGGSLAGFANFGDVWFENSYAKLVSGSNLGILGAKQYQISSLCSSVEYDDATAEAWAL